MDTTSSLLSHLTPSQHQALYEQVRHEATLLRREAMRDAAAWIATQLRALWRAALHTPARQAPHRTAEAPACPR